MLPPERPTHERIIPVMVSAVATEKMAMPGSLVVTLCGGPARSGNGAVNRARRDGGVACDDGAGISERPSFKLSVLSNRTGLNHHPRHHHVINHTIFRQT